MKRRPETINIAFNVMEDLSVNLLTDLCNQIDALKTILETTWANKFFNTSELAAIHTGLKMVTEKFNKDRTDVTIQPVILATTINNVNIELARTIVHLDSMIHDTLGHEMRELIVELNNHSTVEIPITIVLTTLHIVLCQSGCVYRYFRETIATLYDYELQNLVTSISG